MNGQAILAEDIDQTAKTVVDAGFRVHSTLGPGLLESAYELCLAHELSKRGIQVQRQVTIPLVYDGTELDAGYRLDLVANDSVIIEVKSVEVLLPIHQAQLLTYLKLSRIRVGFLMNFNVKMFRDGIKRMVF